MPIPKSVYEETLLDFFAPIRPFMDDAKVSEIMINGPNLIFVERGGKLEQTNAKFANIEALLSALRNLGQFVGKPVDEMHPILEGRMPDGSRVEAVVPPASPDGPSVAIRRFFKDTLTVQKLVNFGALTADAARFLEVLVIVAQNVVVAGGTGSGKTSLLNALSSFIPDGQRIVIIEDNREVQLQKLHVVQLEAKPGDHKGRGKVTIGDLFRATLRMRPDRIVVGEIRGGEALEMVQAMTSGHGGCMATCHATYPHDTMNRLETMCMMSEVEMPLHAMRLQLGSAINIIVQTGRLHDGSRKITHITECRGYDPIRQEYRLVNLFERRYHGKDDKGMFITTFEPTGELPGCMEEIKAHDLDLPPAVYEAARKRSMEQGGGQPPPSGHGHGHGH